MVVHKLYAWKSLWGVIISQVYLRKRFLILPLGIEVASLSLHGENSAIPLLAIWLLRSLVVHRWTSNP